MIDIDDKLMMSEELIGLIPDLEEYHKENKPFISYKLLGNESAFSFYLNSISAGNTFFIEYFCDLKSSLKITKNYNEIVIEEFNLIYNEFISSFEGPFKILNVSLKPSSQSDKSFLLRLDLIKDV